MFVFLGLTVSYNCHYIYELKNTTYITKSAAYPWSFLLGYSSTKMILRNIHSWELRSIVPLRHSAALQRFQRREQPVNGLMDA
jgi:hypothetical protein